MKIAITSTGDSPSSKVDSRFGRCTYFAFYNTKDASLEFYANPNKDASGGAGPASAQFIASKGVEMVFSGDFGGKAKDIFDKLAIEMKTIDTDNLTVEDVLPLIIKEMSKLNGKGPDNKGSKTGRGLGKCSNLSSNDLLQKLGQGLGLGRKKEGSKGQGQGKRLQSGNK
ncbi:MAG: DUF5320 family protein [Paludibacteraceae bacterium]|nr:DUF5320 family protein [Paludibacteraceae bacterium]MBN2787214.1 DUF5320 family protein [Paludibacteraceae bacterium]